MSHRALSHQLFPVQEAARCEGDFVEVQFDAHFTQVARIGRRESVSGIGITGSRLDLDRDNYVFILDPQR